MLLSQSWTKTNPGDNSPPLSSRQSYDSSWLSYPSRQGRVAKKTLWCSRKESDLKSSFVGSPDKNLRGTSAKKRTIKVFFSTLKIVFWDFQIDSKSTLSAISVKECKNCALKSFVIGKYRGAIWRWCPLKMICLKQSQNLDLPDCWLQSPEDFSSRILGSPWPLSRIFRGISTGNCTSPNWLFSPSFKGFGFYVAKLKKKFWFLLEMRLSFGGDIW